MEQSDAVFDPLASLMICASVISIEPLGCNDQRASVERIGLEGAEPLSPIIEINVSARVTNGQFGQDNTRAVDPENRTSQSEAAKINVVAKWHMCGTGSLRRAYALLVKVTQRA